MEKTNKSYLNIPSNFNIEAVSSYVPRQTNDGVSQEKAKPAKKKKSKLRYLWITLSILVLGTCILYIIGYNSSTHYKEYTKEVLDDDEYTDGLVIFQCPRGFNLIEEKYLEVEGTSLTEMCFGGAEGKVSLISHRDEDLSRSKYLEYWNDKRRQKYSLSDYDVIYEKTSHINGYDYYYRMTEISGDDKYLIWRYAIIFDNETDKMTEISAVDEDINYDALGDNEYFLKVLKSIRF